MPEATVERTKPVFEDERGAIFDLLDDISIMHLGVIRFTRGSVRANHYHNKTAQYNYIVEGKFEFATREIADDAPVTKVIVEKGDFVSIPPKLIHAFVALEDGVIMDFNTVSRSNDAYEDDVVRVKIV